MKKEASPKLSENNFVNAMLKSAEEQKEVRPQQRFDDVDVKGIDNLMKEIRKGNLKRQS